MFRNHSEAQRAGSSIIVHNCAVSCGEPQTHIVSYFCLQEAHEAIRPTDPSLLPGQVPSLTPDQVGATAEMQERFTAELLQSHCVLLVLHSRCTCPLPACMYL